MTDRERANYMCYEWSMNWWYTLSDLEKTQLKTKYCVESENSESLRYIYKQEKNIDLSIYDN